MTHSIPTTAIILAGGQSSRFVPFNNRPTHKSMFQIMGKPVISYTLDSLKRSGITKAVIVHSVTDKPIKQLIKHQSSSMQLISAVQEKPLGQANAILAAKKYITGPTLVLNPQQINIHQHLKEITNQPVPSLKDKCVVFSQTTNTPKKYGMLGLKGNHVHTVVEKPKSTNNLSNQRILGIYILNTQCIKLLEKSETKQHQLEETLDQLAKQGLLYALKAQHPTLSLKYAWDLHPIAEHLLQSTKPDIHDTATIHPTAIINGDITIKKNASIHEYAIINGPAYLGPNSVVGRYTEIGEGTILEANSQLQRRVEIKRSLVGEGTHLHSGFIGDSIIGNHVKIGANFITANRRLDREPISYQLNNKKVNSHQTYAGAIIGDKAAIGIHAGTNPGTIIASQTNLLPGTIATGYVTT